MMVTPLLMMAVQLFALLTKDGNVQGHLLYAQVFAEMVSLLETKNAMTPTLILVMVAKIVKLQATLLVQDLLQFVLIFVETTDLILLFQNNVIMDLQMLELMMDAQMNV
jgi:hypothetical protein